MLLHNDDNLRMIFISRAIGQNTDKNMTWF